MPGHTPHQPRPRPSARLGLWHSWQQLEQQQQAFSAIAAWSTEGFDLGKGREARHADGLWVSGDFFQVLEINPVLGRLFSKSDDYRGCGVHGVVISNAFWQREFGGRAGIIGNTLSLDGHPFQIIGVTPRSFSGLEVGLNFDMALPLCSEPAIQGKVSWTDDMTTWWLAAIGRLKPGWTFGRATAQLGAVTPGILAATLPSEYNSAVSPYDPPTYLSVSGLSHCSHATSQHAAPRASIR